MYCTRMLTLRKKELLSSTTRYIMDQQCIITTSTDFSTRPQLCQFSKNVNATATSTNETVIPEGPQGLKKLFIKMGFNKYRLMSLGYVMYGNIVDKLNYSAFYEVFKMPDTFFSWFLVTELHVWMLMVRYMGEGKDGKLVRHNLVEAMWKDVDGRINKLGHISSKIKKKQVLQLLAQFNTALLDYDEGLLSDDKVLAGAIWRIFFCSECNNPEQVEQILIYVRKQISILDKISSQQILCNSKFEWIDLRSVR
ncbi:ubiquinol-cytochrome c reductase complex assembly factor 1 [Megalopta genalis]|uniref:ubiquinol-cytochrome c reductase complex assembly factor 1 n=1 Tax=Megalopta genalis TaxID=115081 RepID=UPI001442F169|nr:ubiquinol-cytochrome-c reductase complex assembly factor 1 [Megalopta genalis]